MDFLTEIQIAFFREAYAIFDKGKQFFLYSIYMNYIYIFSLKLKMEMVLFLVVN